MSHEFDTGMFSRNIPAWHRLGNTITEWPGSWEEARKLGGLTWEPIGTPVYDRTPEEVAATLIGFGTAPVDAYSAPIAGWQQIRRSDNRYLLSIRPSSYKIISNTEFGDVIEAVMKLSKDEKIKFDTVLSLYNGRMVVVTVYLDEPISLSGDPSETYSLIVFVSRHDGQGGLKAIVTNIRVVCANTLAAAEQHGDSAGTSFTIRHTANWTERIAQLRQVMTMARKDSEAWRQLACDLLRKQVSAAETDLFLGKFIPVSSAMTEAQERNAQISRTELRRILESPTCEHINNTAYGLVMAATEWADHGRRVRSADSAVSRAILRPEPYKIKAVSIAKELTGVK